MHVGRGHLMDYHLPNMDNCGHLTNYHLLHFVHVVIEHPQGPILQVAVIDDILTTFPQC